ncbi:MAG: hypothetical protein WBF08_00590 [Candidatus Bathyarchaeia archaeon]
MLQKAREWINKLVKVLEESYSAESSVSSDAQNVLVVLSLFAASIISSLFATWIAQDILGFNFPLIIVLFLGIFILLTTILQTRWLRVQLSAYWIFTAMLTIIIILSISLAWLYVITRPPTVYLVVDITQGTNSNFNEIIKNISFASDLQHPNSRSGLRVYGGNFSGNQDCSDTEQLIEPVLMEDYSTKLEEILPSLKPKGEASLTIAVLHALKDDLQKYRGPIKLIVITSGINISCEPQKGGIFEEIAEDIKKHTRDDITIVIISVGQLESNEMEVLTNYAKSYNGKHLNTLTADTLPSLIQAPQSYFINYPQDNNPTPTP